MGLAWRKIRIEGLGIGVMSSNGKYFIGTRGRIDGAALNWTLYNLRDKTYEDGFRYQRDAKAAAE
jgi:hypothetical protein